jgi:hypothetical protein
VIGAPSSSTAPSRRVNCPAMAFSSVDFPAPLGPRIATISALAAVAETPFRIVSAFV